MVSRSEVVLLSNLEHLGDKVHSLEWSVNTYPEFCTLERKNN